MDSVKSLIDANTLLTGGLAITAFGVIAVWFRDLPAKLFNWGKKFFVTTLSFDSRDELMFRPRVHDLRDDPTRRETNLMFAH